jgi:hypothetical protein
MSVDVDKLNAEAVAKGRVAAGLETTRPMVDGSIGFNTEVRGASPELNAAIASIEANTAFAINEQQKKIDAQQAQIDNIKARIRKIC